MFISHNFIYLYFILIIFKINFIKFFYVLYYVGVYIAMLLPIATNVVPNFWIFPNDDFIGGESSNDDDDSDTDTDTVTDNYND